MSLIARLKAWAKAIKRDVLALWLAARDPRVPWYAKALAGATAAYAFSPIDLVPDFIPIIGYLDDLLIVPAAIALTIRLIPAHVMEDLRARVSRKAGSSTPISWIAMVVIVTIWLVAAWYIARLTGLL